MRNNSVVTAFGPRPCHSAKCRGVCGGPAQSSSRSWPPASAPDPRSARMRGDWLFHCVTSWAFLKEAGWPLTSHFVEGNPCGVETLAGLEQPFDSGTNLQRCWPGNLARPASATEHGRNVFNISIEPTTLEVQRGAAPPHRCSAFGTGLQCVRPLLLRT